MEISDTYLLRRYNKLNILAADAGVYPRINPSAYNTLITVFFNKSERELLYKFCVIDESQLYPDQE